jgi:SHS2 domain-containing protein
LRIRADSLPELYAEAGRGLFSLIVDDLDQVRAEQSLPLHVSGDDGEELLFDWLAELLYTFDSKHLVLRRFDVHVDGSGIAAEVRGEPLDSDRHEIAMEVKAITYHGLKLVKQDNGWLAEVIVDI